MSVQSGVITYHHTCVFILHMLPKSVIQQQYLIGLLYWIPKKDHMYIMPAAILRLRHVEIPMQRY